MSGLGGHRFRIQLQKIKILIWHVNLSALRHTGPAYDNMHNTILEHRLLVTKEQPGNAINVENREKQTSDKAMKKQQRHLSNVSTTAHGSNNVTACSERNEHGKDKTVTVNSVSPLLSWVIINKFNN